MLSIPVMTPEFILESVGISIFIFTHQRWGNHLSTFINKLTISDELRKNLDRIGIDNYRLVIIRGVIKYEPGMDIAWKPFIDRNNLEPTPTCGRPYKEQKTLAKTSPTVGRQYKEHRFFEAEETRLVNTIGFYNVIDLDGKSRSVLFNSVKNLNLGTKLLDQVRKDKVETRKGQYFIEQLALLAQINNI